MIDGMFAPTNPQSACVDDFSLTGVPEPTTGVLMTVGVLLLQMFWRRRGYMRSAKCDREFPATMR